MAAKKKTGSIVQGSPAPQQAAATSQNPGQSKQKVDELVDIIRGLVDARGYFDPKDVHEKTRNTDLAKSASIIMSNLRLQGFGEGDKLRVPLTDRPDAIKKLINLASRLRKKGLMVPFDEAVTMILSDSSETSDVIEPEVKVKPKAEIKAAAKVVTPVAPAPVKPAAHESVAQPMAPQVGGPNFMALYEETKDKALRLEAELEAYKQMCFRLIDTLKTMILSQGGLRRNC